MGAALLVLAAIIAVQAAPQAEAIIREIRIHGNVVLSDADVTTMAGVKIGDPLTPTTVDEVTARLKSSSRFESIDVRTRYRSLDMTEAALVIVVHEKAGTKPGDVHPPGTWSRVKSRVMFLPIIGYNDGLGFTYGGRFSTSNLLGIGERLSVPLTWGGNKQAALEFERTFKRGPISRVFASGRIWQRENLFYNIDETRKDVTARAERQFLQFFRAGTDVSHGSIDFGDLSDAISTFGADLRFDTRNDPAFPSNSVFVSEGWSALWVDRLDTKVNRYRTDARGYLRIVRQLVLAARAQYDTADAPLPPYERYLAGGSPTIRGYDAGSVAGDKRLVTSAELRLPLTSVLTGARLGVDAFFDAGKVANSGDPVSAAPWRRGSGGGFFLIAAIVKANLDFAYGSDAGGGFHAHLTAGFTF
jgi:outer membrane protein assembly factor BamA